MLQKGLLKYYDEVINIPVIALNINMIKSQIYKLRTYAERKIELAMVESNLEAPTNNQISFRAISMDLQVYSAGFC